MDTEPLEIEEEETEEDSLNRQELSPELSSLWTSIDHMQTPCVLMDQSTKVVKFNMLGTIAIQKRGRLLKRRLDQILPTIQWAEIVAELKESRTVQSELLTFQLSRGLEKITRNYHCVFMPLYLSNGLHVLLHLLPIKAQSAAQRPPESLLVRLKDPLTIVLGYLEMIISEPDQQQAVLEQRLKKIATNAQAIANLLNAPR